MGNQFTRNMNNMHQQALSRIEHNMQPSDSRPPLKMVDYAEGYNALDFVRRELGRIAELEERVKALTSERGAVAPSPVSQ